MTRHPRSLFIVAAGLVLAVAAGRSAGAQPLPGLPPPPAETAAAGEDPLKRETPRGSLLGFVTAARAGNDKVAAEYLDWTHVKLGISKDEAARQLMFALNHGFEGNLERLSRSPEGSLADGLPADKERVGSVVLSSGERVDVILSRVSGPDGDAPMWLVAAETVAEIPRLHKQSGMPEIERALPRQLTRAQFGGLPLWVPLALLILLPVIYYGIRLVLGCAAWGVRLGARLRRKSGPPWMGDAWRALSRPTAFLLTVLLYGAAGQRIGIPLYHRFWFSRTITFLLLVGFVWLLWRLQDLVAGRVRTYLEAANARGAQSTYIIGRRALQILTVIIVILVTLAAAGVDLSATLAGLGIGGLALAFAAQKTLENVFAGISVLSDRSVVVGDYCQIGKHVGTVEDVGLRTMRLRTLGRTIVHVPNGTLATSEVENFSRRDKFLLQTTIGLRYETTPEQLDRVLTSIRALLAAEALVEPTTQRVRFIRLGAYSLDVEVFAFFRVPDYATFLAEQERLLVRIMQLVAEAGTGFAFPSQTLYLEKCTGVRP
jgi:MscS family membrane protein